MTEARSRSRSWAAWAPILAALVMRLALLPLAQQIPHAGDSAAYVGMAREFARTGAFVEYNVGIRPPLFRVLVALGLDTDTLPFDPWPASYLLQAGCDLLTCALLMLLSARLFGRRAALAAGWLWALFPTTALYSSLMIMAEPAALALLSGALLALHGVERGLAVAGRSLRPPLLVAGGLLGVGILTKEVLLPVSGAVALGVAWHVARARGRRRGLAAGGLLLAGALLVASPWTIHNLRKHDLLVVSSTATDLVLMHGNMPKAISGGDLDGMQRWSDTDGLADKVQLARSTYRDALFEYPWLTLRRAWTRLRITLGPEVITPAWIGHWLEGLEVDAREGYSFQTQTWRQPSGSWARRVQLVDALATALLFGLAAAGLARQRGGLHARLACLTVGLLVLAYMATWAESRYRLTFLPLLIPFAGAALARVGRGAAAGRTASGDPDRRAERLGLAVALLLLTTTLILPAPPIP